MFKLKRAAIVFAMGSIAAIASAAAADKYPSQPIRIIIATAPGGATDITTRLVANKMSERLGQSIIVENKPGGDTLVGTRYVKSQPANGYTLLAQSQGFSTLPYTKVEPGYSFKDFTGIGLMTRVPFLMAVGGDEPVRTLAEYTARAKAQKLSYGHGGFGSAPHISAELFLRSAGLNDVTSIPYKGNGAVFADLASGRVSMLFDAYISSAGFLKSGKLRALAVAAPNRLAPLPDVPTFKEQGIDFNYSVWLGLLAKAGTPPEAIDRLSDALRYALNSKDLADRFQSEGSDAAFVTPKEFNEFLEKEYSDMAKIAAELKFVKD